MKNILICFFLLLVFSLQAQQVSFYFQPDKSALNSTQRKQLDSLLSVYGPKTIFQITGYTDKSGSPELNKVLANKRAQALSKYLQERGVPKSNLSLRPPQVGISEERNEEDKRRNRRATLVIVPSGKKEEFVLPQVPFVKYEVKGEAENTFRYASGTTFRVRYQMLERYDQSAPKGNITIQYREFRSPTEIVMHQLPMNYQEDSVHHHFNSAGMFELLAFENDTIPLKLKANQTLDIDFSMTRYLPNTNLYSLEEGKWKFQRNLTGNAPFLSSPQPARIIGFQERYNQDQYIGVRPKGDSAFNDRYLVKIKRISGKPGSRKFLFTLMDDSKEHTELDSIIFRFNGKENRKLKTLFNRTGFIDASLADKHTLEVKVSKGKIKIPVNTGYPYPLDNRTRAVVEEFIATRFFRERTQRARIFDDSLGLEMRKLEMDRNRLICLYQLSAYFNEEERKSMENTDGIALLYKTYKRALDSCSANLSVRTEGMNRISASLSISGFGVWNCDQLYRIKDPLLALNVLYKNDQGNTIMPYSGYLIDNTIQGAFSLNNPSFSPQQFSYSANSEISLYILDATGKSFYSKGEQLKRALKEGKVVVVSEFSSEVNSMEEVKNLLQ